MTNRRGYVIFCDDIRREVGGKYTLVGIYRSDMVIHAELPVALPKLGLAIQVQSPIDKPLDRVKVLISLPGDSEGSPSVTAELVGSKALARSPEVPEDIECFVALNAELVLSPVEIKQEGYIRVRAETEGELLRIGALRIRKNIPEEAPQQAPGPP
jgi:hypothetical protein